MVKSHLNPKNLLSSSLSVRVCLCLVAIAVLGFAAYRIGLHELGEYRLDRLLSGDSSVRLKHISIEYQGRYADCGNAEVLGYFDSIMSRAETGDAAAGGVKYKVRFSFRGGGEISTLMYLRRDGFSVSLPSEAIEPGFPTHGIRFRTPMPAEARQLFEFLDE